MAIPHPRGTKKQKEIMKKYIYLWVVGQGWTPFEFGTEETKEQLKIRNISIGNYAKIGYYAKIGDSAKIGNYATIGDSATILKTLFITGSKNTFTWNGNNQLSIGCLCKTFDEWLKDYERIGKIEGYSDDEIKEYYGYIMIAHNLWKENT